MNNINQLEPRRRRILEQTGALLTGHFRLSSGLHSQYYFQCARLFQYPEITEQIVAELAPYFAGEQPDVIITPAVGGIILGYELARSLHCRAIFTERQQDVMTLRRGFEIQQGEKVLIAEDVVTTGASVLEIKQLALFNGAEVKGFCSVVNRSGGKFSPPEKYVSWLTLELETFTPDTCPLCQQGLPLVYPGSRKVDK
ncbi:MAG: orotate phosphoribosyltransferase [Candidatus Sumerlaeia bacterium]|nr:orotate phosphoribosyltransferase [Candidatus Sumerlaeia bacterium]